MSILAVLIFSIITLGLGHSVLSLTHATRPKNLLLYLLEVLGVGLATFSFLGVALNLLRIPLYAYVYLALSLIVPIIDLAYAIRDKEKPSMRITWNEETVCVVLLIILMGAFFGLYYKGATSYPYLEDDDPWGHAEAAMYVAQTHTYSVDPAVREINRVYAFYLEPYPPTYDVLMGLMRQLNDSLLWTLKFFNVLLITLGLAFFYLLAKAYLKSDQKAIFATIAIACLPSFMSHFIFSQALALVLFPIALYAMLKALDDTTWRIPAIILIASELVTQPVVSFIFGIIVLFLVLFMLLHEWQLGKGWTLTKNAFISGAGGFALSFLFWGPQLWKWGLDGFLHLRGAEFKTGWVGEYALQKYNFWSDVVNAPMSSRIDQAVGFGTVISFLLLLSAVVIFLVIMKRTRFSKISGMASPITMIIWGLWLIILLILLAFNTPLGVKLLAFGFWLLALTIACALLISLFTMGKSWQYAHLLFWFLFLFYVVFAPSLGLPGWGSSRIWPELAIPLVLLVTEGSFLFVHSITKKQTARLAILIILLIGIGLTSLPAKIAVQTAQWPPGAQWTAPQEEVGGYLKMMGTIPKNSRVYPFCGGEMRAIGFDMQAEPWDLETAQFRQRAYNVTPAELMAFITLHNYEYITVDATCVKSWGVNETTRFVQQLNDLQHFQPVISTSGFLLAKVV